MSEFLSTELMLETAQNKVLDLEMRDECMNAISNHLNKMKNLRVDNIGYREFYPDGRSMAFCSNIAWYDVFYRKNIEIDMSIHYAKELKELKRMGYNFVIRTLARAKNRFLKELLNCDMCNSLLVYKKEPNIIKMYSFIAHTYYQTALDYFITERDMFVEVIDSYADQLSDIFQKDKYNLLKRQIFNKSTTEDIFSCVNENIIMANDFSLTPREAEFIPLLLTRATNKDIATKFNISPRTASYHVTNIRKKLRVSSRFDIKYHKEIMFNHGV